MSLEQWVVQAVRRLSPDRQREALDFIEFLETKSHAALPRRSLRGLCADLGVDISAEEIDAARRDMWGSFPREDIA
jgi:hypothetical protein